MRKKGGGGGILSFVLQLAGFSAIDKSVVNRTGYHEIVTFGGYGSNRFHNDTIIRNTTSVVNHDNDIVNDMELREYIVITFSRTFLSSSKSLVYNLEVALVITFLAVVGLVVFFVSRRKKAKTNILLMVDGIPLSYDGEYLTWQTTD